MATELLSFLEKLREKNPDYKIIIKIVDKPVYIGIAGYSQYFRYQERSNFRTSFLNLKNQIEQQLEEVFKSIVRYARYREDINDRSFVTKLTNDTYEVSGKTYGDDFPNIGRPRLHFKINTNTPQKLYELYINAYEI